MLLSQRLQRPIETSALRHVGIVGGLGEPGLEQRSGVIHHGVRESGFSDLLEHLVLDQRGRDALVEQVTFGPSMCWTRRFATGQP